MKADPLSLAGVALVALAGFFGADPARAQNVGAGVEEALAAQGRVRVVVVMEAPAEPHAAMEAMQAEVMDRVQPGDFEVAHRYSMLPAMAGWVTEQGLAALRSDPHVHRIDLDAPGSGELAQSVPLIRADALAAVYGLTGEGITVAVLDSGMDPTHPDLLDALDEEQCFCSGGGGCCPGGGSTRSGPGAARDDHFHGTHVTSIVTGDGNVASAGVAPAARIVAIKVLDRNNSFCCSSDVVAGLDWVLANRPDVRVVNMSLGTFATFAGDCDDATAFTMLYADAIDQLTENGVAVFTASGNTSNAETMKAPGCVANAISVGSTSKADAVASFSGGGPTLDLLAPGVSIRAARKGGGTRLLSGTSMSSPHAAGLAALLLEAQSRLRPGRLRDAMADTGVPVLDPGSGLVFPRIDAEAALLSLEVCDDAIDNDDDGLVDVTDPDCPPVSIDIRPRSKLNLVALFGRGFLPVAVLGAEDLDVLDVDPTSLAFGPGAAGPVHDLGDADVLARHLRDVNRDGFTDLVSHIRAPRADLAPDATQACLAGSVGNEPFRACDGVITLCRVPRRWHWWTGPRIGNVTLCRFLDWPGGW